MGQVDTTRVSSRGQVVLPKGVRDRLGLHSGDILAVYGEGDTVVLKRLRTPSEKELQKLHQRMKRFARRKGLRRKEVARAIAQARDDTASGS